MKVNKTMTVRALLSAMVLLGFATGCSKKSSTKNTSAATGWKINDPNGGFQYNSNFTKQETGPGLVLVEGGTFTMGKIQDDVMHDWNNTPSQQHVQSFYMDETEVTNIMYMEYLDWIKRVFPPTEENYKHIYNGALPDTLVWRNRLGYNETMTNNYLRHPAYSQYPVVGVNWLQATEFAKWRTNRVNENILERQGYMKKGAKLVDADANNNFDTEAYLVSPSTSFGGNEEIILQKQPGRAGGRSAKKSKKADASADATASTDGPKNVYAQKTSGIMLPEYRLPTEAEWEYAAAADVGTREYNIYRGQKKYPWKGQYTRSGNRVTRGDQLANFKQGKGDYGGIAGWSDDNADITAPVKSYKPNDFGLYDMAGNVAEWVQDVYRPIVDDEANDFNYFRGNVFTKNQIDKDGKIVFVTSETIKYDTLSNGKVVARNKPGEIAQVPVDENETYLRQNFSQSNNIGFKDGDKQSSRFYYNANDEDGGQLKDKKRMYDSPIHKVEADSTGKINRKFDKSEKRTTLVGDDVRVYKGGSWRDRAYWLDPASRRYLNQDIATDYIGFRCAMSRVGPKSDFKKTPRNRK